MKQRAYLTLFAAFFLMPLYAANAEGGAAPAAPPIVTFGSIAIDMRDDGDVIKAGTISEDSPGAKAGLKTGDAILAIDGKSVSDSGLKAGNLVGLLRGKIGTTVKLTIQHDGDAKPVTVALTRTAITVAKLTPTPATAPSGVVAERRTPLLPPPPPPPELSGYKVGLPHLIASSFVDDSEVLPPGPGKIVLTFDQPYDVHALKFSLAARESGWIPVELGDVTQISPNSLSVALGPLGLDTKTDFSNKSRYGLTGQYAFSYCLAEDWKQQVEWAKSFIGCPANANRDIRINVVPYTTSIKALDHFRTPGPSNFTFSNITPLDPNKTVVTLQGPFEAPWPWQRRRLELLPQANPNTVTAKIDGLADGSYMISECQLTSLDKCDHFSDQIDFTVGDIAPYRSFLVASLVASKSLKNEREIDGSGPGVVNVVYNKNLEGFHVMAALKQYCSDGDELKVTTEYLPEQTKSSVFLTDLPKGSYLLVFNVTAPKSGSSIYPTPSAIDTGASEAGSGFGFAIGGPYHEANCNRL